jgi:histidinol-phosphate aminotransferase
VRPYGNEGARVSIGAPEENDAFLAFAAAWTRPERPHTGND